MLRIVKQEVGKKCGSDEEVEEVMRQSRSERSDAAEPQ